MSDLRWGIVGCGDVVEKKSGPSILAGNRSRIVAAMRRDRAKLDTFADVHNISIRTGKAEDIYQCPEVDIVYIATPPYLHREQVIAAAKAGKHVLVEKPMGMSAAESADMVVACKEAGVELFVAYYRRFQPHVSRMRQIISESALGKLIHGQVEYAMPHRPGHDWGWRTDSKISGGGLFADVVSHRIDLMISFFGAPELIHGIRHNNHVDSSNEDVATVIVKFSSGAQCTFIGNFAASKFCDRFVLTGTNGEIHTDNLDSHTFNLSHNGKTETISMPPFQAPHNGLVHHIERVLSGEEINQSSGASGLLTDQVLDTALRN